MKARYQNTAYARIYAMGTARTSLTFDNKARAWCVKTETKTGSIWSRFETDAKTQIALLRYVSGWHHFLIH